MESCLMKVIYSDIPRNVSHFIKCRVVFPFPGKQTQKRNCLSEITQTTVTGVSRVNMACVLF